MKHISKKSLVLVILFGLAFTMVGISAVAASGAQVTVGELNTFAAGPGRDYDISGRVQMVRTANGQTLTTLQVSGLVDNTTYPAHVHNAPCNVGNGGGHYQDVVGGPVNNMNEIWPGFTTNSSGHGSGYAANEFTARPEAQSVVIHDTDGARIACADLK